MAESIITQVSKEGNNSTATLQVAESRPIPWWKKLCCFSGNDDHNSTNSNVSLNSDPNNSNNNNSLNNNNNDDQNFFLLPPDVKKGPNLKCLVLDLDETLVHSSFKPIPNPDFIVPVEIEDTVHKVYVLKRPGVDEFLKTVGPLFEVVIFTASLAKYADPVLDLLDIHKVVDVRLFRESCSTYKGNYVKDLGRLGRELDLTLIIDNSPTSYLFNPDNALPCETWFDDENDTELLDILPFLVDLAKSEITNVRPLLKKKKGE